MTDMLQPGARIGILGGGQLGRMLAMAAARLGFDAVIYTPDEDSPASRVAAETVVAPYEDLEAVRRFAQRVDVVTYEFENVPVETAHAAAAHAPVRPDPKALEVAQDRCVEKEFVNANGAATVPWRAVGSRETLGEALDYIGTPAILKTRRFGYDGKGQAALKSRDDAQAAFEAIGARPAILEGFAQFTRELSILAARGLNGEIRAYPLSENRHGGGILKETEAPAEADEVTRSQAFALATNLLEALDYIGLLAVELFDLGDGRLLVNEIAPRVHNTGHWTMDACLCDQFEQHIRAIAGWPLGDPEALAPARMINLIGEDALGWRNWLNAEGAVLHLYGKREVREGRKMGHVNIVERG
ncbi:5-(carboxyamino)imidazole ribonucleotide synthase [Marinicauda algicola]|uniref:N5-carboxyaminoimidazole ribonucleotide synthase n=1 Tax=Marinicauda algicola TaxID=2029849 RepID=A0A4S2H1G3_9PROT|nr:5-(carboxyamino)imidazole ribonucleotide synthase [Marinicauda algicola]TGY89263.1 5-(carboxyamino)imidazole ribonucleotide synthase [Marinicauda algicola]